MGGHLLRSAAGRSERVLHKTFEGLLTLARQLRWCVAHCELRLGRARTCAGFQWQPAKGNDPRSKKGEDPDARTEDEQEETEEERRPRGRRLRARTRAARARICARRARALAPRSH